MCPSRAAFGRFDGLPAETAVNGSLTFQACSRYIEPQLATSFPRLPTGPASPLRRAFFASNRSLDRAFKLIAAPGEGAGLAVMAG